MRVTDLLRLYHIKSPRSKGRADLPVSKGEEAETNDEHGLVTVPQVSLDGQKGVGKGAKQQSFRNVVLVDNLGRREGVLLPPLGQLLELLGPLPLVFVNSPRQELSYHEPSRRHNEFIILSMEENGVQVHKHAVAHQSEAFHSENRVIVDPSDVGQASAAVT